MVSPRSLKSLHIVCLVTLLTSVLLSGCAKQKSSYDLLSEAQEYHKKGQDNAAVIELKNALQKDPKNGEARYLFALIHIDRGEGAAAEIELRKALQLGVSKDRVYAELGKSLLLQQEYQKILDDIQPSDEYSGKLAADIYIARGNAYIGLGKTDEAKSAFDTALKKFPKSAYAHLGMAHIAALQDDLDEALHQTDIALTYNQRSPQVLLAKASLLRKDHKLEDAKKVYGQILEIDKSNIAAHLGMASLAFAQNDIGEARTQIEAANKIDPKSLQVKYMRAVLNYREEKYADARDDLQDVMKQTPDYMPGILLSGAVLYQLGSYEQAHQYLTRFLGQVPDDVFATNLLAATDLHLNQPSEALKYLGQALKKTPENPEILALTGEAYMQTKDYAKATEYLAKASGIEPNNAALRAQLGASRLGFGQMQQAIEDLESAAAMDPNHSKADALLVVTYMHKGEYAKALNSAHTWEQKQPKNPIVYFVKGEAYAGMKDLSNARKSFETAVQLKPDYFPAVLQLAKLDIKDKDPKAAKKRLEDFLKIDKNNIRAMVALADVAAVQKQGQEYVRWLKKASQAKPDAIMPRAKLIYYFLANNNAADALRVANAAVKDFPDSPEALGLLGTTELAAGDNKSALRSYAELIKKSPEKAAPYIGLAMAQARENNLVEARSSLEKALKLQPDFPQALDMLIQLDMQENKSSAALKIARQIQTLHPESPLGYEREADILTTDKQYTLAVKGYESALAKGGGSGGLIKLHRAMLIAGDKKNADQRLQSWVTQHPQDVVVIRYAAYYYLKNNRNKDAITQYENLVKLEPDNALALNNLANLYLHVKDSRDLATAQRALKLNPDNAGIQDTLGWILVEHGHLRQAEDLFRKAIATAPNAGIIHYHLAIALSRSGHKAEAKKELETAISVDHKFPELDDAKAMLKKL